MIDDDDDYLDGALFDEEDQDTSADPALALASSLVVSEPLARPEDLSLLEVQFRYGGSPPMLFTGVDERTGEEVLENQDTFARVMGRPGMPVSYAEALAWIADKTDPATGRWKGG